MYFLAEAVFLCLIVPMKGNLNAVAYNDILDSSVLSLWVKSVPFLFQHDNAPLNKAISIRKWFAQSPDLNTTDPVNIPPLG